jgi:hypothetical protein
MTTSHLEFKNECYSKTFVRVMVLEKLEKLGL